LDSILAQTYQNWELIAVNDHSSDDSPKILQEYAAKDSRVRFFNSDKPKLIPTLQVGYAETKGTLINRMDSDDKMPDYKIQVLVEEWNKHGKGTVIAGGTKHFVDEGVVGGGFIKYEEWLNEVAKTSTHYQEIYSECVIPSHCWIIHKEDFEVVGLLIPLFILKIMTSVSGITNKAYRLSVLIKSCIIGEIGLIESRVRGMNTRIIDILI